jgi:hypothetical protein
LFEHNAESHASTRTEPRVPLPFLVLHAKAGSSAHIANKADKAVAAAGGGAAPSRQVNITFSAPFQIHDDEDVIARLRQQREGTTGKRGREGTTGKGAPANAVKAAKTAAGQQASFVPKPLPAGLAEYVEQGALAAASPPSLGPHISGGLAASCTAAGLIAAGPPAGASAATTFAAEGGALGVPMPSPLRSQYTMPSSSAAAHSAAPALALAPPALDGGSAGLAPAAQSKKGLFTC